MNNKMTDVVMNEDQQGKVLLNNTKGPKCINFVIFMMMLSMVFIIIANALFIFKVYDDITISESEKERVINEHVRIEAVEASFISTGLSMIGIAISVFGGLNIIQFLEKKDFDNVIEKASEDFTEKQERQQSLFKEQLDKNLGTIASNRMYTFKNDLLRINDIGNKWFYDRFADLEVTGDYMDIVMECISIENIFSIIYKNHYDLIKYDIKAKYDEILPKIYNTLEALEQLKQLKDSQESNASEVKEFRNPQKVNDFGHKLNSAFRDYLIFRLGEVNFYMGYVKERYNDAESRFSNEEIVQFFEQSIKYDIEVFGEFGEKVVDTPNYPFDKKVLLAYIYNAFGESCSKIIDLKNSILKGTLSEIKTAQLLNERKEYVEKAEKYFSLLVELFEKEKDLSKKEQLEREVYCRNYAYSIRRSYNDDKLFEKENKAAFSTAKKYFDKSIEKTIQSQRNLFKVFRGWGNLYVDFSQRLLKRAKVISAENKIIFSTYDESGQLKDELDFFQSYTKQAEQYMALAEKIYYYKVEICIVLCVVYRNKIIIEHNKYLHGVNNKKEINRYIELLKDLMEDIKPVIDLYSSNDLRSSFEFEIELYKELEEQVQQFNTDVKNNI